MQSSSICATVDVLSATSPSVLLVSLSYLVPAASAMSAQQQLQTVAKFENKASASVTGSSHLEHGYFMFALVTSVSLQHLLVWCRMWLSLRPRPALQ